MNIFEKKQSILIIFLLIAVTGCNDFLKEESVSDMTSDSYYTTEEGYESLINSSYTLLRDITQARNLVLLGTDLFTENSWNEGGTGGTLSTYNVSLNSSLDDISALWDLLYREVGRCNTAITRVDDVEDMDDDLKAVRLGEAKFLRAYCYFQLVQQWGDVPMPLTETLTASTEVTRVASSEVYAQILEDLDDAEEALPETASDYGRATKGAAQFLLARVYLTRGWNYDNALGGSSDDFDKALEYADKIISAYPLATNYSDLFPQHAENPLEEKFPDQDDTNDEIVFAVQYSDDVLTYNGDPSNDDALPGNNSHSIFGGAIEEVPGQLGRTSDYNRHLETYNATPAVYRLYDPQMDTRYQWNFVDAIYALDDETDFSPITGDSDTKINISIGDTVILYRPWNDPASTEEKGIDEGGSKLYSVINTDEFSITETTPYHSNGQHPLMWKFWQPGIDYGDAYGTLDQILFRSAEAYLIAAEAIVKGATGGSLGGAEVYYNTVLDRALGSNAGIDPECAEEPANVESLDAISYRATSENIDIDLILDERARELLGENVRWYDLKRTGTLIERTSEMNPWTALKGEIDEHHLVRPIPQSEIDRSSTTVAQNDGY